MTKGYFSGRQRADATARYMSGQKDQSAAPLKVRINT